MAGWDNGANFDIITLVEIGSFNDPFDLIVLTVDPLPNQIISKVRIS